jgi:prophage antirepressor-like protein
METAELEQNNKGTRGGKKAQFNLETFKVSAKMNLIPEEGAYSLIIDSKLPIASVVL